MTDKPSIFHWPIMQYGFAGMCAALLGIVVWMVDRNDTRFDKVLQMQQETNRVIERNTAAIANLADAVHRQPIKEKS